jgi:hypothetical protein
MLASTPDEETLTLPFDVNATNLSLHFTGCHEPLHPRTRAAGLLKNEIVRPNLRSGQSLTKTEVVPAEVCMDVQDKSSNG